MASTTWNSPTSCPDRPVRPPGTGRRAPRDAAPCRRSHPAIRYLRNINSIAHRRNEAAIKSNRALEAPAAGPADLQPEDSAGFLIRDTHLLFAKALRNRLQTHQITPGQWYFLRALWAEEGLSQRELSRRVGTTEPTTVSALRLLARNGLISRVRNPDDRRTINIFLTDKARDLRTELMPMAFDVNENATAGFSPAEFSQLRSFLRRIRENLAAEEA